jgi:hypothetical protein
MMPVAMVRHAVTAGRPPMAREISIETAAVADFGAKDSSMVSAAPSILAAMTPETMLVSDAKTSATRNGRQCPFSFSRFR